MRRPCPVREMGTTFVNNDPSFYLQDGSLNDGYLLHIGVHLTKPATNELVANLSLQLRHGEMSTHADHRKLRPDGDMDRRTPNAAGASHVITGPPPPSHPSRSQRHGPRQASRRPPPGRATQPQPTQSQPRAVPSTQATPPYVSHPGAPSRGRDQGSHTPGRQHLGWQQQRNQRSQIVRRQTPGGYRGETHFPERQINLPSNSSPRFRSACVDPNHASSNDSGLTCQLCLGNGHTAVTCKSRDSVCYRCHQKGHFSRVCDQKDTCSGGVTQEIVWNPAYELNESAHSIACPDLSRCHQSDSDVLTESGITKSTGNDNTNKSTIDLFSEITEFKSRFPSNFIFMHLNINSYRHKFVYVSDLLNKKSVDYLAISETKLVDNFP